MSVTGNQEPRVAWVPDFAYSLADDCAFFASSYGLVPDPWQFTVLEGWLCCGLDGRWVCGRCGLAVPRQNGKNGVVEMVELFKMVSLGRKILHTAHEVKTCRKAFIRLVSYFENPRQWPELANLVREIRKANGEWAIVLWNGGSCEFIARTRKSGRGFTVDDLIIDEAQELDEEQLDALQSTIAAAPSGDPTTTFIGTPPTPTAPGEIWKEVRKDGCSGKDRRLAYFEWSPRREWAMTPKPDDLVDEDWEQIADCNPALGYRLLRSTIEDERKTMSADGFARERGGLWPADDEAAEAPVISFLQWKLTETDRPPASGAVAFGVKFSPDGQLVAVSAGLKPEIGAIHVEGLHLVEVAGGLEWLVEWVASPARRLSLIVVDGKAHAGGFVNALRQRKIPERRIHVPTVGEVITAHSMFLSAVVERKITHLDDEALSATIASAGRRQIGNQGGWGLQSVDGGDVTLAESLVMAHFAAYHARARREAGQGRKATVA